jgi:uncharacterized small protein (DUF1192 family)
MSVEEIYNVCELMHTTANQEINTINDKIERLNEQREYQKGLRDAAYTILHVIKTTEGTQ